MFETLIDRELGCSLEPSAGGLERGGDGVRGFASYVSVGEPAERVGEGRSETHIALALPGGFFKCLITSISQIRDGKGYIQKRKHFDFLLCLV